MKFQLQVCYGLLLGTLVTLRQKALKKGFELSLKSLGNTISYSKIREEGLVSFKMYVLIL